jgi:hypothetical protein
MDCLLREFGPHPRITFSPFGNFIRVNDTTSKPLVVSNTLGNIFLDFVPFRF